MKHPKDRGDRRRVARKQHRELYTDGRYRPQVVQDKRDKYALRSIEEELEYGTSIEDGIGDL
jgi:hypothetical protein